MNRNLAIGMSVPHDNCMSLDMEVKGHLSSLEVLKALEIMIKQV